ncbi:MAG: DUF4105 domain-containing protein [Prevotella sp.]|nr:DUF4105 domain-containing protein [Prevotella sp.]
MLALVARAQQRNDSIVVLPDSSNFVTASVLVTSPGKDFYSILGHSAIRLQCPSKRLDYCFSYESNYHAGAYLLFILGQTKAGFYAVPTDRYLNDYRQEGRGITEYTLNLTHHEKQELWRSLDNHVMKGLCEPFDFIFHNCTSMLFIQIQSIMQSEDFRYPRPMVLSKGNRPYVTSMYGESPWMDFLYIALLSAYTHQEIATDNLLCPPLMATLLESATIEGLDGSNRPALAGKPSTLVKQKLKVSHSPLTPIKVFSLLLAFCILLSIIECWRGRKKWISMTDTILFAIYTFYSLILVYVSVIKLFGISWNWMLVVFNPLPFLLWLLCRKKPWYRQIWLIYAIVISTFMVFLPCYTGQMEIPHLLLLGSMMIRCISKYKSYNTKLS